MRSVPPVSGAKEAIEPDAFYASAMVAFMIPLAAWVKPMLRAV
jgi:hypothetical protein